MPELSGLSLDEALIRIENTNLTLGDIRSQFDKHKPLNFIIQQEPAAGYRISQSSPVNLIINRLAGSKTGGRGFNPLYGSFLRHRIGKSHYRSHGGSLGSGFAG